MRLTYWYAAIRDDSSTYNIRARTRAECDALRKADGAERYDRPRKVVLNYEDAFDLVCLVRGEGRGEP